MADRLLKKGWIRAMLTFCDREWPVVCKVTHTNEWCVIIEAHAPDSCFAEPAEPDSGAPELRPGERVYVDAPHTTRLRKHVRGWGVLEAVGEYRACPPHLVCNVRMDKTPAQWWLPRAACHREGPQSKPLHEDDVFLGRYPYGPDGALRDGWWADGKIRFEGSSHGVLPANISFGNYADALAVARELGLVEAEKDEPAPEPERPEPRFQVGQWVELGGLRFCIDERKQDCTHQKWAYSGCTAAGSWITAYEADLEPCAPVLTAAQEAMLPGDVVENVEILVGSDGVPLVNPSRLTGSETIESVTFRLTRCHGATLTHGRVAWLWNLWLVRKADA